MAQVGLTDLSSVSELTEKQRQALCRLYQTLWELEDEDSGEPSEAAEVRARAAMESVGLVIDLPPAGGTPRRASSPSSLSPRPAAAAATAASSELTREEEAALALARAAEDMLDVTFGGAEEALPGGGGGEGGSGGSGDGGEAREAQAARQEERWWAQEEEEWELEEQERQRRAAADRSPPLSAMPLTYVMLLRGLFDTQRDGAIALVGGGGEALLKGMAVRRLPQAITPVLRMVANLRGVCAHLVSLV